MNLLVVDFDYFFQKIERVEDSRFPHEYQLYDWGHTEEDRIFYEYVWQSRAAAFLRHGVPLPQADEWLLSAFWNRFRFAPHTTLFFADQNMYAAHERTGRYIKSVWLFDAHHDAGYHPDAIDRMQATGEINSENWMLLYAAQDAELHMRYPKWRHYALAGEPAPLIPLDRRVDDGADVPVVFDRVFVCKSPAWVPSWCDADWQRFLAFAPVGRKVNMDGSEMLRSFDLAAAQEEADVIREGFARLAAEKAAQ